MTNAYVERRRGAFQVSEVILKTASQEVLEAIFHRMIIVNSHWTEGISGDKRVVYNVAHPDFDPLKDGEVMPEYKATVFTNIKGNTVISVKWERKQ